MFETRKELFSKIDAQTADIARLEAELIAEQAKVNAAINTDETVAALNEDLQAAQVAIGEVTAAKDAEISTLQASLAAAEVLAAPEAIQALVTAQIAASGHPPLQVETGGPASQEETKTISRAAFSEMTPSRQSSFCLQGGKITD